MSHVGRRHLTVVALLLLLAAGVTGLCLLLQRPQTVQVASPPTVEVETPPEPTTSKPSPTATIRVHVTGAVNAPGVLRLPEGSIVLDALEAAGGLTADADPELLNMAAPLSDGAQVVVGTTGEPAGEIREPGGGPGSEGGAVAGAPVNLNQATEAELEELPGVGPVLASSIVAWREENGGFSSVEDLMQVSGIGTKVFERLSPLVRV